MDLNQILIGLKDETGIPVEQDIYTGKSKKWIVFTYEDERGQLYGDDQELHTTCVIQVTLYTPKSFNYMTLKKTIKEYLIAKGFQIEYIRSWTENETIETEYIRHTLFQCNYTE